MESKVFKCTLSDERLARTKKLSWVTNRIIFPSLFIFYVIYTGMGFFGALSGGVWNSVGNLLFFMLSFFINGVIVVVIGKSLLCLVRRNTNMDDLLEDKEFSWDAHTNEFTYRDKYRTILFTGDKVIKWKILSTKRGLVDILLLNNGEQIVLESEFNPVIHPFLDQNKYMLHLPFFSKLSLRQILFLNYYKDSIW